MLKTEAQLRARKRELLAQLDLIQGLHKSGASVESLLGDTVRIAVELQTIRWVLGE
jgi:hypothetical protein